MVQVHEVQYISAHKEIQTLLGEFMPTSLQYTSTVSIMVHLFSCNGQPAAHCIAWHVIHAPHSLCFTKKHMFSYSGYISVHLLHEQMTDCDNDVIVDVNQMTKRRKKMKLNWSE